MGKRKTSCLFYRFIHSPDTFHEAERDAAIHLLSFFPDLPSHFTVDHYLSSRRTLQELLWPTVRPLPGVTRLIHHLHKHNIPIAVATSSQRRNFFLKSSHLKEELFDLFGDKVMCADDGYLGPGRGKPHPDIFLHAAKVHLNRDVGEGEETEGKINDLQKEERARGLVFEDAIPGVQAGKRAGMKGMPSSCPSVWINIDTAHSRMGARSKLT